MKYRPLLAIAATVAMSFGSHASAVADQSGAIPLDVKTGHSIILPEHGLTRVAVGDGKIAGVLPIGNQQIVINGKTPGHTSVYVWAHGVRILYEVSVLQQDLDNVSDVLRAAITEPDVEVVSMSNAIIVRGYVESLEQFGHIDDLLSRFKDIPVGGEKGGGKIPIINAVLVRHPLGELQRELSQTANGQNVRVDGDAKGNVIVSGLVHNRVDAAAVIGRANGLAAPFLATDGKVIDRLEVEHNTEIDVKVSVLEVDETGLRELGISLQSAVLTQNGYVYGSAQFPIVEGPDVSNPGKGFTISRGFLRATYLAPTLAGMIQEGHARELSSPDLVTIPGNEADFLVGGEVPYVYSSSVGTTSVQFKDYGVKLKVTPSILPNGAIQAQVAPEISDLDFQDGVIQNGFSIPALKTSRLSTTAITQPGESLIMGGMLRHVESRTIQRFPILGELPILGQLFRSVTYQNNKSDVVFVMTPQIVTK